VSRVCWFFACAVVVAVCAQPLPCRGEPAGSDPRTVAVNVARSLRVQDSLPSDEIRSADEPRAASSTGSNEVHLPVPSGADPGSLFTVFAWTAGILVAGFFLMSLVEMFAGGRLATAAGTADAGDSATTTCASRDVLVTADQLAAAGCYTEAIHQLLTEVVAVLRRRLGSEIAESLTSREILRRLTLQPQEQNALRDMIVRVERTWFAQRDAQAEDYRVVRENSALFGRTPGTARS
jgi:Domain of unknown function (DUF4129)